MRPVAFSLPSAVSGRRLALPPLPYHSRLPSLRRAPCHPRRHGGDWFAHTYSPATTRSNLGFKLSPRVWLSKTVMRNPLHRLHPLVAGIANRRPACRTASDADAAPARTAHHDHFMRCEIAEAQPPIALFLLQLHGNKIQTLSPRVHSFRRSGTHKGPQKYNSFTCMQRTTRLPISRMRLHTSRVMRCHFKIKEFQHARRIRYKRTLHARVARFHIDPQGKSLAVRGDAPRDYATKSVVL